MVSFLVTSEEQALEWLRTYDACNVVDDYKLLYTQGNTQTLRGIRNLIENDISFVMLDNVITTGYNQVNISARRNECFRYLTKFYEQQLLASTYQIIEHTKRMEDVTC